MPSASPRAGRCRERTGPADLQDDTIESALSEASYRRLIAFDRTLSLVEAEGEAAILIRGTVEPLENLSEHVIVLVTLTEDGAVDANGRSTTHWCATCALRWPSPATWAIRRTCFGR